jgi:hypothetical protein
LLVEIKTIHEMHGIYLKIVVWALNIRIWPTGICVTVVTVNVRLPSNQLKRLRFTTHNRARF